MFLRRIAGAVLCAAVFFISGCSGGYEAPYSVSGESRSVQAAASIAAEPVADEGQPSGGEDKEAAAVAQDIRKLVKRASLSLRVENLEEADKPVQAALKKYRGYAARAVVQEGSRSYILRVPSSSYEAFLSELAPLGKVVSREESAEDVTLRYYDLEGRLTTKKTLLATYRSYLGKAADIEEILSVESRIADLQGEIDRTGSQLKNLSDLIDYATIELYLHLPASSSPSYEPGIGERIAELFISFGGFLSTALVVTTGVIVYGIPILIFAAFAYWLLLGKAGVLRHLWRIIAKKNKIPDTVKNNE
ncbi:MAG: DUF4349 domain-containing protein [Spirochaetales bacterium]|jgi:hypothetical protein|nr:DUF4349 domain-containing protein [Spirochaetales bacterium]